MVETPNQRPFRESKLMITSAIATVILTTLPMVNMTAENLRDNHYYFAWVERGTQEQKNAYWAVQDQDAGTLLVPLSFLFQNRYQPPQ